MKRSTSTRGVLIAALTPLMLAASAPATSAGNINYARNDRCVVASATPALPSSSQKATVASPLTLLVEAPTGVTLQLRYVQDAGWSFVHRAGDSESPPKITPTATEARPAQKSELTKPLTVFIDGPTGFTYVWLRDAGWKFVGRIAGAHM